MDNKKKKKIYVVGHKNPDTDSICSAIAYASLKRKITDDDYHARRAGQLNEETQYVLERFQVDPPKRGFRRHDQPAHRPAGAAEAGGRRPAGAHHPGAPVED